MHRAGEVVTLLSDIHLFPNTPEGHALIHQLQQRAEAWAEGVGRLVGEQADPVPQGIMTMIFSTDDFCMYGIHITLTE